MISYLVLFCAFVLLILYIIFLFWYGRCKVCGTSLVQGYDPKYGEEALITWCPKCGAVDQSFHD